MFYNQILSAFEALLIANETLTWSPFWIGSSEYGPSHTGLEASLQPSGNSDRQGKHVIFLAG